MGSLKYKQINVTPLQLITKGSSSHPAVAHSSSELEGNTNVHTTSIHPTLHLVDDEQRARPFFPCCCRFFFAFLNP